MPVLVFILLPLFSSMAAADDRLIEVQCHNAEVPAVCMQCVNSDPEAGQADRVGVAAIVLNCLTNHSKTLYHDMAELASSSQDKNTEAVAKICQKGYSDAGQQLGAAAQALKSGDYDMANASVREALENDVACGNEGESCKLNFPPDVVYEMRVYEELADAALRIIDRL
ncbi:hypothetical protein SLEP1_g45089 [Rubroshorea leprosula]|uniref:Pectinesterase inhibitor domain-containing protein n=1 Tax=Rubroshorea leprosula TaxID=152421 RepID=A0AAV5LJD2_9ROSI|nr:hypothetical protein SLEP1_g45089 [Rubroshorea leprosula]